MKTTVKGSTFNEGYLGENRVEEVAWELESAMKEKYLELFGKNPLF